MRKSRFTEGKIIAVLKEHDAGVKAEDLCRPHGISGTTFYKWKAKFGGMDASDRGAWPCGKASVIWREIHSAIGLAVTPNDTQSRRP